MKKIIVIVLSLILTLSMSTEILASTADEVQKQRNELEKELNNMEIEADEIEGDIQEYNNRYNSLRAEVEKTEERIAKNAEDIDNLNEELEKVQNNLDTQYLAMKERIAFTYENRNKSVLTLLLESDGYTDFINRVEFITAIVKYDNSIIETYAQLKDEIETKTKELKEKQGQLDKDLESASSAKNEMKKLADEAGDALTAKNDEINAAQMSLEEFDKKIKELRRIEKAIADANAAALAEQMKQIQDQLESGQIPSEDNSGAISAGEADVILLAATVQAEADGEGYEGRLGVASVILNRVNSSLFPGSISQVVYQPKQFSCVNYTLPLILQRGPNEGCLSVAREALAGKRNTSALFFMTPAAAARLGQSGYPLGNGGHVFFDVWQR